MEDSVVEYIFLDPWQFRLESTEDEVDSLSEFVVVAEEDIVAPKSSDSSWWGARSLQLLARTCFEWAGNFLSSKVVFPTSFQFRGSTIHESYDWVSDTNIEGGRLILPGQLISLDDTSELHCRDDKSSTWCGKEYSSSSTIMVSAHDLLACSRNSTPVDIPPPGTTLSLPKAVMQLARQRARNLATASNNEIASTYSTVWRRVGSLLHTWEHRTGLAATTAGLIHQALEWYLPGQIEDQTRVRESTEPEGTTGSPRAAGDIELPSLAKTRDECS